MTDFHKTWYVDSGRHKYCLHGLLSLNTHDNSSFAYLFFLANNVWATVTKLGVWVVVVDSNIIHAFCCS